MIAPALMSRIMTPKPREKLGGEEHGENDGLGPARQGDEQERCREEHHPEDEDGADPETTGEAPGHGRPEQAADRAGAEDDPERPRAHVQLAGRIEDEECREDEVEEVERRHRREQRAQDAVSEDEAHPLLHLGPHAARRRARAEAPRPGSG